MGPDSSYVWWYDTRNLTRGNGVCYIAYSALTLGLTFGLNVFKPAFFALSLVSFFAGAALLLYASKLPLRFMDRGLLGCRLAYQWVFVAIFVPLYICGYILVLFNMTDFQTADGEETPGEQRSRWWAGFTMGCWGVGSLSMFCYWCVGFRRVPSAAGVQIVQALGNVLKPVVENNDPDPNDSDREEPGEAGNNAGDLQNRPAENAEAVGEERPQESSLEEERDRETLPPSDIPRSRPAAGKETRKKRTKVQSAKIRSKSATEDVANRPKASVVCPKMKSQSQPELLQPGERVPQQAELLTKAASVEDVDE